MKSVRGLRAAIVLAGGCLFAGAPTLHASLDLVDIFKNVLYQQTSGAAPTSPAFYFADVEATMQNPGDFTSVTVTYPGPGSPVPLPLASPNRFGIGPSFATQGDMDTAFPFGTYTFQTNTSLTAALNYLQDAYTSDIPALDAATFNALQGMNPALPFTFHFNSFTPSPNASHGATFLSVGSSFGTGGLSPSSTSAVMSANTLLPSTTYTYELDFSDRVTGTDPNSGVPTLIGFDVRTDGTFTTGAAVPEPSSMVPLAAAFLGIAALRPRRKAR